MVQLPVLWGAWGNGQTVLDHSPRGIVVSCSQRVDGGSVAEQCLCLVTRYVLRDAAFNSAARKKKALALIVRKKTY